MHEKNHKYEKVLLAAPSTVAPALATPAVAADFIGLTTGNEIGLFSSSNASTATFNPISGPGAGECLLGIDLRPNNNRVCGVSSLNRLCTLDVASGAATFMAALDTPLVIGSLSCGIDFDPVADFAGAASLRCVSNAGQNLAINVDTGVVGNERPGSDRAVRPRYHDRYPAHHPDGLQRTDHHDSRALGISGSVIGADGFEIDARDTGRAALKLDDGDSGLYSIDPGKGLATFNGALNANLRGFTSAPVMAPVPEAETRDMQLSGLGLIGMMARRRSGAI